MSQAARGGVTPAPINGPEAPLSPSSSSGAADTQPYEGGILTLPAPMHPANALQKAQCSDEPVAAGIIGRPSLENVGPSISPAHLSSPTKRGLDVTYGGRRQRSGLLRHAEAASVAIADNNNYSLAADADACAGSSAAPEGRSTSSLRSSARLQQAKSRQQDSQHQALLTAMPGYSQRRKVLQNEASKGK